MSTSRPRSPRNLTKAQLIEESERFQRELAAAREQQAATSEILRVISRSPANVGPVFDTILASATRLCAAQLAVLWRHEGGDLFRAVAFHGASPEYRSWLGSVPTASLLRCSVPKGPGNPRTLRMRLRYPTLTAIR